MRYVCFGDVFEDGAEFSHDEIWILFHLHRLKHLRSPWFSTVLWSTKLLLVQSLRRWQEVRTSTACDVKDGRSATRNILASTSSLQGRSFHGTNSFTRALGLRYEVRNTQDLDSHKVDRSPGVELRVFLKARFWVVFFGHFCTNSDDNPALAVIAVHARQISRCSHRRANDKLYTRMGNEYHERKSTTAWRHQSVSLKQRQSSFQQIHKT